MEWGRATIGISKNSVEKGKIGVDKVSKVLYYMQADCKPHMEQYRSGHNGHDWKSCVPQKGTEGSNPSCSAINKTHPSGWVLFFVYRIWGMRLIEDKFLLVKILL